jgi:hypothetical protein
VGSLEEVAAHAVLEGSQPNGLTQFLEFHTFVVRAPSAGTACALGSSSEMMQGRLAEFAI